MAAYICKSTSVQKTEINKLLQKVNQLEINYQSSKAKYPVEFENIIKQKSPRKPFQPNIAIKYSKTKRLCKFFLHNQKCPFGDICRFPHSKKESETRQLMGPSGCWRLAKTGHCSLEQNCIYDHSGFPTTNSKPPQKCYTNKCRFCQGKEHKLTIYCPAIPEMDFITVKTIIKTHEITCNMCFGTDHKTSACIATKIGLLNKCTIVTKSGSICNELHHKSVHYKKTIVDNLKVPVNTQEEKPDIQISWSPFQSKIFEDLRPIQYMACGQNKSK